MPSPHESDYLEILLEALSLSGLEIQTLNMGRYFGPNEDLITSCVLPVHLLNSDDKLLSNLQAVIAKLRTLKLSVWVDNHQPTTSKFAHVFNHAAILQDLELEIVNQKCTTQGLSRYIFDLPWYQYELDTSDLVKNLLQQTTMPVFESLRITGGTIDLADIRAFVKRHGSLKVIYATWCEIRGIGSYEASFEGDHARWSPLTMDEILEGTPLEQKLTQELGEVRVGYLSIPERDEQMWDTVGWYGAVDNSLEHDDEVAE